MSLTARTLDLCELLADVGAFAADDDAPDLAYLHLHTGTTPLAGDPAPIQVLAATATDGYAAAHAVTRAAGRLPDLLLTAADAAALVALWRPIARAVPQGHPPHEIALTARTGPDGPELHTAETQLLFDHAGPTLTVQTHDVELYPVAGLTASFDAGRLAAQAATGVPRYTDGARTEPAAEPIRTDLAADRLAAFVKIAARRKHPLRMHRYHQDLRLLLQIGDHFTGTLMPIKIDTRAQVDAPDAPRVFPTPTVNVDTGEALDEDVDPDPAVTDLFRAPPTEETN